LDDQARPLAAGQSHDPVRIVARPEIGQPDAQTGLPQGRRQATGLQPLLAQVFD
jgi:hypothetical protein